MPPVSQFLTTAAYKPASDSLTQSDIFSLSSSLFLILLQSQFLSSKMYDLGAKGLFVSFFSVTEANSVIPQFTGY